jgi:tetratricopeptide (TPR) repeat protein
MLLSYKEDTDIQTAIANYVYDLYLQFGEGRISDEKHLISLMYMLNQEISRRLQSPNEARQKYFSDLHGMLGEIQELQYRLKLAGIKELDSFTSDLSNRIKLTIDRREIDFKKKKVFEDALQMLYVSEEMIKLDQLQNSSEINQKIGRSKQQLLSAFGEVPASGGEYFGRKPTIYDLFVEWKKTEQVKYSLRLADVKLIRINLLKSSNADDILKMFNEQLELAYTSFNYFDYDLAERLLGDILETYPEWGIRNLDDVYFYRAEANFALDRLSHARDNYEELLFKYPGTSYLPRIYSRLVQINYTLDNAQKTIEYATLYQNIVSTVEPDYYDLQFLMAMSYYQLGNYSRTIEALMNVPPDNPYYHLAQYFIGNAYSDSKQYDEAAQIYLRMIEISETPPYLHARALYKMGIMEYERMNYFAAVAYLNRISFGFDRYDKVLNALAWSYFELERSKPEGERKDFSMARHYVKRLIDEYYASPYKMEATGLMAYISQFEDEPVEAIGLYREVYQTKVKRVPIEQYLEERQKYEELYAEAKIAREQALKENDEAAFVKANQLVQQLRAEIEYMDLSESSRSGVGVYREANSVIRQIKELNELRLLAEESNNETAIHKIDSLQLRLGAVLESFPEEAFQVAGGVNLFDDYPVSKYVVDEEFRHQDMQQKQEEVVNEIAEIDRMINEINNQIDNAKIVQNFELVARLEQEQNYLRYLRKRYDVLLVAIHETDTDANPYPEFSRWGDFGAFGIINVYFDQKQRNQTQLVKVAEVFERVNKQLNSRKQGIENKIKKIEAEVRLMTMKARMEERARLRAERERAFRESYFDTRESEIPEEQQ